METGLRSGSLTNPINVVNKFYEVAIRRGRFIRFTTFGVRDRDISNMLSAGISAFGIMRQGCSLYSGSPGEAVHPDSENMMYVHNVSNTNTSITLHFKDVVEFHGWFLVTTQQTPALDPAVFEVETSDDGEKWRRVASSLRADQVLTCFTCTKVLAYWYKSTNTDTCGSVRRRDGCKHAGSTPNPTIQPENPRKKSGAGA